MATEFSGAGDPRRSIELLWGSGAPARRGPRPRLSVEEVVRAAVEVADEDGLAATSMRRVAERLDVTVMSLYTYVPAKAELTDLMVDRVLAPAAPADPVPAGGSWRERLERVARDNWATYHRPPWLLEVVTARPPLGPGVTARYDAELAAVDRIGLTDVEMDAVLSLVLGHVEGAARRSVDAALVVRRTGLTDEQWWKSAGPALAEVFDPERFPLASRVGAAAGEAYGGPGSPTHAFEFGLARILDGIDALVATRSATP